MTDTENTHFRRDIRPDAQAFDEIRVETVPRYKESEMSGDEWRIGAKIEFYRKGRLMHSVTRGDVEYAAKTMYSAWEEACSKAACYAGEGMFCDQESCSCEDTKAYKKKKKCCSQCGTCKEITTDVMTGKEEVIYRRFCNGHKTRGDCGLDDADRNYEEVEVPPEK